MSSRFCLLLAVLVAFLAPGESYGDELEGNAHSAVFVEVASATAEAVASDDPSGPEMACGTPAPPLQLTVYPSPPEGDVCLARMTSLEEAIDDFRRAQVERRKQLRLKRERERDAKRRAKLMRCALYLAEKYGAEGQAYLPLAAPSAVQEVICAANSIATTPYIWGGGHGSFESSGYDCSGAVSFALHGGGFLRSPLNSEGLEGWGESGPGKWITVYTNTGHAWMVVAGVRFDTREPPEGDSGPRWHSSASSPEGFIARHPTGY